MAVVLAAASCFCHNALEEAAEMTFLQHCFWASWALSCSRRNAAAFLIASRCFFGCSNQRTLKQLCHSCKLIERQEGEVALMLCGLQYIQRRDRQQRSKTLRTALHLCLASRHLPAREQHPGRDGLMTRRTAHPKIATKRRELESKVQDNPMA